MMSDEELKRILLTTGYTSQTDKEAVYDYIKELENKVYDYYSLGSVIECLRVPIFPTLEHCFMFVSYLAKKEKCEVLQELIAWMLRRIRADRDAVLPDYYMTDNDKELFKEFLDRAKNYVERANDNE